MYPFARMIWQMWKHRADPALSLGDVHVSRHHILPWDLDLFAELNNGRTLTIYDLGRVPAAHRMGLTRALRENRWGMTMAGVHVRYRRRLRVFETVEMRTTMPYWDDRFLYIEQSMWKANGECANHALYRGAITDSTGIVPAARAVEACGHDPRPPKAPDWIDAWIDADALRPWPPHHDVTHRLPDVAA